MRFEQRNFWKTVTLLTVGVILLILAFNVVFGVLRDRSVRSAEQRASTLLERAAVLLSDDDSSTVLRRVSDAGALASSAAAVLSEVSRSADRHPSAALSVRARVVAEELSWLTRALPTLDRLARFDAGIDARGVRNRQSALAFLYVTRSGMADALIVMSDAPASLRSAELQNAIESLTDADGEARRLLISLGDDTAEVPSLERFVSACAEVTAIAETLYGQLTDAAYLGDIAVSQ